MVLGPNTNLPLPMLASTCIISCGENHEHFEEALSSVFQELPTIKTRHKCYEFWRYIDFLAISSGMGTGAIEPLLWEILGHGIVKRIVLLGTAGGLRTGSFQLMQPVVVSEAFLAGTALDGELIPQPLVPRWDRPTGLATVRSASTDFFYGFSPRIIGKRYPFDKGHLRERYFDLDKVVDIVEMEVAQFYCFCKEFDVTGRLNYIAIKAVVNSIDRQSDAIENSVGAVHQCVRATCKLLKS